MIRRSSASAARRDAQGPDALGERFDNERSVVHRAGGPDLETHGFPNEEIHQKWGID
jgi:hypothetical protein